MSWTPVPAIEAIAYGVFAVVVDPQHPNTLYTSACLGSNEDCSVTVLKSPDRGTSWTEVNSGLPTPTWAPIVLAIDPRNTNTLYPAIGLGLFNNTRGLFKTTDGGASWSAVNLAPEELFPNNVAIDPQNTGTVYAGTRGGVFKSTDGGTRWSPVNSGLVATTFFSLAIDPQFPSTIYAGTCF